MFDMGAGELLLILIAVLVFFGPKKMPQMAQSLGRGIREFKRAQQDFTAQINRAINEEDGRQRGSVAHKPIRPMVSDEPSAPSILPPGAAEAMINGAVPPKLEAIEETDIDWEMHDEAESQTIPFTHDPADNSETVVPSVEETDVLKTDTPEEKTPSEQPEAYPPAADTDAPSPPSVPPRRIRDNREF